MYIYRWQIRSRYIKLVVIYSIYMELRCNDADGNVTRTYTPLFSLRVPCYWHGWTLIPVRISNHIPGKVKNEIAYSLPCFYGGAAGVREWISNCISHFIMGIMTNLFWDKSLTMLIKYATDIYDSMQIQIVFFVLFVVNFWHPLVHL